MKQTQTGGAPPETPTGVRHGPFRSRAMRAGLAILAAAKPSTLHREDARTQ